MDAFGRTVLFGLCWGFLWGIGCSLAILYSIYLGGYRRAVKDSLKPEKPKRYTEVMEKVLARKAKAQRRLLRSEPL
jgi:hypothetical protein